MPDNEIEKSTHDEPTTPAQRAEERFTRLQKTLQKPRVNPEKAILYEVYDAINPIYGAAAMATKKIVLEGDMEAIRGGFEETWRFMTKVNSEFGSKLSKTKHKKLTEIIGKNNEFVENVIGKKQISLQEIEEKGNKIKMDISSLRYTNQSRTI